jgi:hypothetical protein
MGVQSATVWPVRRTHWRTRPILLCLSQGPFGADQTNGNGASPAAAVGNNVLIFSQAPGAFLYNTSSNQWMYLGIDCHGCTKLSWQNSASVSGGSNIAAGVNPVYGAIGVADPTCRPGSRSQDSLVFDANNWKVKEDDQPVCLLGFLLCNADVLLRGFWPRFEHQFREFIGTLEPQHSAWRHSTRLVDAPGAADVPCCGSACTLTFLLTARPHGHQTTSGVRTSSRLRAQIRPAQMCRCLCVARLWQINCRTRHSRRLRQSERALLWTRRAFSGMRAVPPGHLFASRFVQDGRWLLDPDSDTFRQSVEVCCHISLVQRRAILSGFTASIQPSTRGLCARARPF